MVGVKRVWVLGICLGLIACGGSNEEFIPSTGPDGAASEEEGDGVAQEGEEDVNFPAMGSFEQGCLSSADCGPEFVCANAADVGACALTPGEVTGLTNPFTGDPAGEDADVSCVGLSVAPLEVTAAVTMHGIVDRVGSGLVTENILVRVFDAALFTPWECDGFEEAERNECLDSLVNDGSRILGEAVSSIEEQDVSGIECETDQDCPKAYACVGDLGGECKLNYGVYELEGMPLNTPLVVMTKPNAEDGDGDWHATYVFSVILEDGFQTPEGLYRFDPLIVGEGQWKTVPGPFFTEIEDGNGAIGGRVRDCVLPGTGKGGGWYLPEATVGFATLPSKIGYFNDKEEDSLPDAGRTSTNIFGRFTGLDVVPGPNVVSAAVKMDGDTVSLGAAAIYVFPDALSVVSLPGRVATYTQE